LIAKTGATIGKLGMIPREMSTANTTSSVAKISVDRKRFDNKYILYSFMSPNFREQLKLVASQKSAQPGFNNNELVDFYISVPTKGEQIQISSYLDNKTSLIDKLINNNKKLIKLLEEKRTALINKVVTKGLDPNVKMKDSGIEWIGEIPEHWLVGKVRWYFEIGRGRVIANRDLDEDGKYPVYSSQTKNNGAFGFLNTYDFEGKYLTWTTDGANAGTVSYREGRFNCTNVCGTLKSSRDINLEYYGYFLNQATNWFVRKDINPKLMNNVMAGIPIPLPSLSEQIQISSYLDNKTSLIDKAIKEIKNKNIFLEEYRQSLISNVVTGKIKVANL
jgi:type I restriction enzyme S subunit